MQSVVAIGLFSQVARDQSHGGLHVAFPGYMPLGGLYTSYVLRDQITLRFSLRALDDLRFVSSCVSA